MAKATAKVPKTIVRVSLPESTDKIAPTTVMPEIAFDPLISGVCNWEGTFEINSTPKKIE